MPGKTLVFIDSEDFISRLDSSDTVITLEPSIDYALKNRGISFISMAEFTGNIRNTFTRGMPATLAI